MRYARAQYEEHTQAARFSRLVRLIRENLWGGADNEWKESAGWPARDEVIKLRSSLLQAVAAHPPPVLTSLIGRRPAVAGMLRVHAFMQSPVLVSSLLFTLLDAILSLLYDDLPVIWGLQVGNQQLAPLDTALADLQRGIARGVDTVKIAPGLVTRMGKRIISGVSSMGRRQHGQDASHDRDQQ